VGDRVEIGRSRRVPAGLLDGDDAVHAERALRLPQVVPAGQVPPAAVEHDPVRVDRAGGRLPVARAVLEAHLAAVVRGHAEREERPGVDLVALAGRIPGQEPPPHRVAGRLDLPPEGVRQHAVELGEGALDRVRGGGEPDAPAGEQAQHDGQRLFAGEHERRQLVAGAQPVAARAADLGADRDADLLERRDVAAHGPGRHAEPARQVGAGEAVVRLQQLEQGEQAGGRMLHSRSVFVEGGPKSSAFTASLAGMEREGQTDFDFLMGSWKVHNRRRKRPRTEYGWEEFEATVVARPLWGGLANVDEFEAISPSGPVRGMTVRLYDPVARQWHLHWANAANGTLDRPTVGRFRDGRGDFYDQDRVDGKVVLVRYVWSDITPASCRWEQAFSEDGGRTWEDDWFMDFTRTG
jgi:hypothetical protein